MLSFGQMNPGFLTRLILLPVLLLHHLSDEAPGMRPVMEEFVKSKEFIRLQIIRYSISNNVSAGIKIVLRKRITEMQETILSNKQYLSKKQYFCVYVQ